MLSLKKQRIVLLVIIAGIYLLAWTLQSDILLNWDVSWLMHVSGRLLDGGTYTRDFFEINPPMILFLYIPPVLIAKISSINIILALRIYIFLLSALSLSICFILIPKIFSPEDGLLASVFFLVLACIFLLVPVFEFGQREHLLVLFAIPYLLLLCSRLQGAHTQTWLATGIGLLAGLVFALKPHFLIILALMELFCIFYTRKLSACIRAETLAIAAVFVAYLASVFIFFKEYIFVILPFIQHFYYSGFTSPWLPLMYNQITLFCALVTIFYLLLIISNPHKILSSLLLLAMIGGLFSYALQQTIWYYHALPAYSLAILLLALLFILFAQQTTGKFSYVFFIILGMIVFSFPFYNIHFLYNLSENRKQKLDPLIAFIHERALRKPVYFFTTSAPFTFPLVDYAGALPATRVAFLGWIPGFLRQENLPMDEKKQRQHQRDKDFLIHMLSEDILTKKPVLVFIDSKENKDYMGNIKFDYLDYFAQNKDFQMAWKNYHYLTTIENLPDYQFNVYQRNT